MEIKEIAELTKDDLLSDSLVSEVFEMQDELKRTSLINRLRERANELRCTKAFNSILKAFQDVLKQEKKIAREKQIKDSRSRVTDFGGLDTQFRCAAWIADDGGIVMQSQNPFYPDRLACYHPIIPLERMRNLQTGEEQIKLSYKRRDEKTWNNITVAKSVVASAQRIIDLANYGIAVNSNNAKWLVAYLADVENLNNDKIPLRYSTSKLGWITHGSKRYFLPYRADDIEFDGDTKFHTIYEAIREAGDSGTWVKHMRKIRASGHIEPRLMMAASFASILIKPCGTLPFIVDLWGDTESGKTVMLMVAASIWADPGNNVYIGDYKATDTALETKADMLNSLPLILDDTSKVSKRLKDSMEGLVYDLCSGKGKSRSNKSLGINRENTWNCSILTCGEKPLQDYVDQGGAINRIIEIQCGDYLFDDPHETAELVKANFGYAGKMFAHAVALTDPNELERQRVEIFKQIARDDKMQKQAYAMSVILLADRITEKLIFQDGVTITPEEAMEIMTERQSVSDNQRAYEYLIDKVDANPARFDPVTDKAVEQWGFRQSGGYIGFFPAQLERILREEQFGLKPLLTWLDKRGLIDKDNDGKHFAKKIKINGKSYRLYRIKVDNDDMEMEWVQNDEEFMQAELPLDGFDKPF